mgnify:CR=1 FL=1
MDQTYMKEKPILPLLLSMALPMVISMFVNSLYNIIDSIFVAKISEDAMTALSLVYPVQNLINSIAVGFGVGINAVIAMFLGAGKAKEANKAATQGLFLNVIHGILLTIVGLMIMPSFLAMFTNDQTVIGMGLQYSTIILMFSTIIMVSISFEKIFQAVGNMVITMIALMTGCIVNIVLDPLLIFGIGFFPKLGIQGAALATGIGQSSTLILYLIVYVLRPIHVKIRKDYLKLEAVCVKRLYAIGIPATLNMALPSFLVSALNAILASFSQTYVVVLGVYYKLQTFLYLTANGMIQGMRPIMSYNYGAKNTDRVKGTFFLLLKASLTYSIILWGLVMLFPQVFAGIFTSNPALVIFTKKALRVYMAVMFMFGIQISCQMAFNSLGKAISSIVVAVMRKFVLLIPLIYIMPHIFTTDQTMAVYMAEPVADFIAVTFTAILFSVQFKKALAAIRLS